MLIFHSHRPEGQNSSVFMVWQLGINDSPEVNGGSMNNSTKSVAEPRRRSRHPSSNQEEEEDKQIYHPKLWQCRSFGLFFSRFFPSHHTLSMLGLWFALALCGCATAASTPENATITNGMFYDTAGQSVQVCLRLLLPLTQGPRCWNPATRRRVLHVRRV